MELHASLIVISNFINNNNCLSLFWKFEPKRAIVDQYYPYT